MLSTFPTDIVEYIIEMVPDQITIDNKERLLTSLHILFSVGDNGIISRLIERQYRSFWEYKLLASHIENLSRPDYRVQIGEFTVGNITNSMGTYCGIVLVRQLELDLQKYK
jgi:hypothetical protein